MKSFVLVCLGAAVAASSLVLAQPPLTPRPPAPQFEMAPNKLPDKPVQDAVLALLAAVEGEDFANFLRVGTDEFKADLTHEKFVRLVEIAAARLEKGYAVVYFGELKKAPYTIHMWKLSFKDEGRELLGEISIKDGKVVGFYIH